MDFDLAKRHSKEVEKRRQDAKRKLEQQRKDEAQRALIEQERAAREEIRLREEEEARERAEREARSNEGVHFVAKLRPYPSARTDDKLVLPPSALEDLDKQGAIENGTLLTFSVSLPGTGTSTSSRSHNRTHAGVAEFTAEEGTVGVPPRVALCLTKGAGLGTLAAVGQVEVRYYRLPRSAKSRVKFQPRGEGFHAGGLKTAYIDLQHVLEETLRGHTALTEGDWLPIRHDGETYELMVKELEPEPMLALLDTDLTVEVLPSESTEAQIKAEEERKAREEEAARLAEEREKLRIQHAKLKAESLPPEPDAGPDVIQMLVRLPSGSRLSRRFRRDATFKQVLTWVESEPDSHVTPNEFRLVQKWPGHIKELGPDEGSQTLSGLKFARQEALFLQHLNAAGTAENPPGEEDVEMINAEEAPAAAAGARLPPNALHAGEWSEAVEAAHQALDRRLEGTAETPTSGEEAKLEPLKGQELVDIFNRLRALGMDPEKAAIVSKKFSAQLKELGEMGLEDWLEAAKLLEKYNGRLRRVANLMLENPGGGGSDSDVVMGEAPAFSSSSSSAPPPPPPMAAAATPAASTTPPRPLPFDKAKVAAKYQELVAAGVPKQEAAEQAIQALRSEMTLQAQAQPTQAPAPAPAPAPAAPPAVEVPPPSSAQIPDESEKMKELIAMGFTDEDQNRMLLKKYAGRMERVIGALCG